MSQFLDARGLAAKLHVSPETILTWARRGRIPFLAMSHRPILFDLRKVRESLKERPSSGGPHVHCDTALPNLLTEKFVSLSQAASMFPPYRRGRPVSPSCLWRWVRHGVRLHNGQVVRLEAVKVAGRHLTTVEAVRRFIGAQQIDEPAPSIRVAQPVTKERTTARRQQESERAFERLKMLQSKRARTGPRQEELTSPSPEPSRVDPHALPRGGRQMNEPDLTAMLTPTDTIDVAGYKARTWPYVYPDRPEPGVVPDIDQISVEKLWHTGFDVAGLNEANERFRIGPLRDPKDIWTILGYSANPKGEKPRQGRFTYEHVTALAFPYPCLLNHGQVQPYTDFMRLRYPRPVRAYSKNDMDFTSQRYGQPPKGRTASHSEPYFLVDLDQWTRIYSCEWPLLITEGELKGAALGLAGLAGIAFPGAWMWTAPSKSGKNKLHHALDPRGPRKDWCIPITDRPIFLLPDVDFRTNQQVKQAFRGLAHALNKAGSGAVRIVHIPDPPRPDLWKGIDDYLTHFLGPRWAGNDDLVKRARDLVTELLQEHSELVRSNDRYEATTVIRGADRLFEKWQMPESYTGLLVAGDGPDAPVLGRLRYHEDHYLFDDVGQNAGNTNGRVSVPSIDLQRIAAETYEEGVDLAMSESDDDPNEMPTDFPNKLFATVNRLLPQMRNETLVEPFEGAGPDDHLLRIRGGLINLTRCFEAGVSWDRRCEWLVPPTHRWFGTSCLQVSLSNLSDPPTCPTFLEMIANGFEGDPERIGCLQLFFGKVITSPLFLGRQQFLSLYGVAGSGKSTIYRILLRLLGDGQVAELRANFGGRFDTSAVPGKRLLVFAETPDGVNGRFHPYMADVIKAVTGQDRLTVEKKCRTPISIRAECEVMTIGNHPPTIPMEEGAFRRRAVFLRMSKPIAHRDSEVESWMVVKELPGIIVRGLEGASRLFRGEQLATPAACKEDLDDASANVSPEERFVNTEIVRKENGRITPSDLEERYRDWLRSNRLLGNEIGAKKLAYLIRQKFGIGSTPTHIGGRSVRVYLGLGFLHHLF